VHARRRTCLVVERAQTREPPVPLGGWLPHRVPALNDLDNLGLTIGGPSHHPSSLTNSKRNLRVLVDRQLADLEGLPQELAYIFSVVLGFLAGKVCPPTEEFVIYDESEHFRRELRTGVVLVLLDGVRIRFDQFDTRVNNVDQTIVQLKSQVAQPIHPSNNTLDAPAVLLPETDSPHPIPDADLMIGHSSSFFVPGTKTSPMTRTAGGLVRYSIALSKNSISSLLWPTTSRLHGLQSKPLTIPDSWSWSTASRRVLPEARRQM